MVDRRVVLGCWGCGLDSIMFPPPPTPPPEEEEEEDVVVVDAVGPLKTFI